MTTFFREKIEEDNKIIAVTTNANNKILNYWKYNFKNQEDVF